MKRAFQDSKIVFLDPDNGIGYMSRQHATLAEVAAMRSSGRAVVVIKFPGRQNHDIQIAAYHSLLRDHLRSVSVITVRTCVSIEILNKNRESQKLPRIRWFTILDADDVLIGRAETFAKQIEGISNCRADLVRSAP